MTIELLQVLSLVAYVLAAVFLLIAIALFFLLDVPKLIGDLSGTTAKKAIADIRQQNEEGGEKKPKALPVVNNTAKKKPTGRLSQTGALAQKERRGGTAALGKGETTALRSNGAVSAPSGPSAPKSGSVGETSVIGQTTVLTQGQDAGSEPGQTTILGSGQTTAPVQTGASGQGQTTVPGQGKTAASEHGQTTILTPGWAGAPDPKTGYGAGWSIDAQMGFLGSDEIIE